MSDLLILIYPWVKSLHIMAVMSWMAGLFYLPRLFVHHAEKMKQIPQIDPVFIEMEYKLLRVIMNPAMIVVWILGLCLVFTPGVVDWSMTWPYIKALCVIGMTVFHHWLAKCRKDFTKGENKISGRQYRIMNEVPTILMIGIVISVIVKF